MTGQRGLTGRPEGSDGMKSGDERPDERATEQQERSAKKRERARRARDVIRQTRSSVTKRTPPESENPAFAGTGGNQRDPDGTNSAPWKEGGGTEQYATVNTPTTEELDRALFARNLRAAKELTGVGQLELSRRTGIPRQQLRRYEQGIRMPSVANLASIAAALSYPVDWFLTNHGGV